MKKATLRLCLVTFLGLVNVACAAPAATPAPVIAAPTATRAQATTVSATAPASVEQALRIAVLLLPGTIDGRHANGNGWYVYNLMYDPLARIDEKGNPIPALAESWEVINPTTWRFHLRKGVKFHNGEEFDAQDVKTTFDYDLNPDNKYMNLGRVSFVKKVEIVDNYTVDFTTSSPNAATLTALVTVYIRPNEYFAKVGLEGYQKAPVGSGPFRFMEWQTGDHVTLAGYKDYWGGAPKLATVKIVQRSEESTALAALEAGEVDIIQTIAPEQIDRIKAKGFVVAPVLTGQSEIIPLGQDAVRPKPLQDKRVRQAMAYAIDLDAIIKGVTSGYARKLEGQLVGPDTFGFSPDLKAYPYDPGKAKALLAEAGYPTGFSIKMELAPRSFREKEVAEVVAGYWKEVGIETRLDVQDFSVWSVKYLKGESGDVFNQPALYLPAMDIDYVFGTLGVRKTWQDKKFEDMLKQSRAELDRNKRLKILQDMSTYLREEAPVIPIFQIPVISAMSPRVQGVVFKPDSFIYLDQAEIK